VRLPARRRIQRRPVQYDAPSFLHASVLLGTGQNFRFKLLHKRIVVINPFCRHSLHYTLLIFNFASHSTAIWVYAQKGSFSRPSHPFNPHPPTANSCSRWSMLRTRTFWAIILGVVTCALLFTAKDYLGYNPLAERAVAVLSAPGTHVVAAVYPPGSA